MSENISEPLRQEVECFFGRATKSDDLRRRAFASFAGLTDSTVKQVFPRQVWQQLRNEWALGHVRRAMKETFGEAEVQEDFPLTEISSRVKHLGTGYDRCRELIGEEWREYKSKLPTVRDKVMAAIEDLKNSGISSEEFTVARVFSESGRCPQLGAWFSGAMREARREIISRQAERPVTPPDGVNARCFKGGWVDLDADVWDLRPRRGGYLIRDSLRADLAGLAWSLLREDLASERVALSTLSSYFLGFKWTADFLGKEVPDIRKASLEGIQRAWRAYEDNRAKRIFVRRSLLRVFPSLVREARKDQTIDGKEMLLIAGWLATCATVSKDQPCMSFLSDEEFGNLINACLIDIKAGIDFTEGVPDLLGMTTKPFVENNSSVIAKWSVALMLLVMAFTGLRPNSVVNLMLGDWVEARAGLYLIVWRHGKKREEKAGVLPAALAGLLDIYVERTSCIRELLKSNFVFLLSNTIGYWSDTAGRPNILARRINEFVQRHGLRRGDVALRLNPTMLRRTYTTRELYEGRSIWSLRIQLGHERIGSTWRYGKFDLFEHPSRVRRALDQFGRKSLDFWSDPILLDDLDPGERSRLLAKRRRHEVGIGLCRHDHCVKAREGSPPPCSMCIHLVTGPEFLPAWEEECGKRERELGECREDAESLRAQKRYQLERFKANLNLVKGAGA